MEKLSVFIGFHPKCVTNLRELGLLKVITKILCYFPLHEKGLGELKMVISVITHLFCSIRINPKKKLPNPII